MSYDERPAEKPDLRPLPETEPTSPASHGWKRGARDWFWSDLRRDLDTYTGGAATYNDERYPLGGTLLELIESVARENCYKFPSEKTRQWVRAGLKAASYSVDDDGEVFFQGPSGLPEPAVDQARDFAKRRALRGLRLFGEQTGRAPDRPVSGDSDCHEQEELASDPASGVDDNGASGGESDGSQSESFAEEGESFDEGDGTSDEAPEPEQPTLFDEPEQ